MTIKAHFDGRVFVPDEPVDVPVGTEVSVELQSVVAGGMPLSGAELAERLAKSDIGDVWRNIVGDMDSTEYARKLRRQAETRGHG